MTTTVRIQSKDKEELDKLQATILLKTGKKLTYNEILHYLLTYSKDRVIEAIVDNISTQVIDWERNFELVADYDTTDSSDINDVIYGDG